MINKKLIQIACLTFLLGDICFHAIATQQPTQPILKFRKPTIPPSSMEPQSNPMLGSTQIFPPSIGPGIPLKQSTPTQSDIYEKIPAIISAKALFIVRRLIFPEGWFQMLVLCCSLLVRNF